MSYGTRSGIELKIGRDNLSIYADLNADGDTDDIAAAVADDLAEANADMAVAWREYTATALGHSTAVEQRWLNDTAEYGAAVKAWNGRSVSATTTQEVPQQVATAMDEWARRLDMLRTGRALQDYLVSEGADEPEEAGTFGSVALNFGVRCVCDENGCG